MWRSTRLLPAVLAVSLCDCPADGARVVEYGRATVVSASCRELSSTTFLPAALSLKPFISLHSQPRVNVVHSLREFRDTAARDSRRLDPVFEGLHRLATLWLRCVLSVCASGMAMMAVVEPDESREALIARVASLLDVVRDLSELPLTGREKIVLGDIQEGTRDVRTLCGSQPPAGADVPPAGDDNLQLLLPLGLVGIGLGDPAFTDVEIAHLSIAVTVAAIVSGIARVQGRRALVAVAVLRAA